MTAFKLKAILSTRKSKLEIRRKHSTSFMLFLAMVLSGINLSCTGSRVKEKPVDGTSTTSGTGASATAGAAKGSLPANSLAMLIIAKLKANIKAKANLPDAQIDLIGASAERQIVNSKAPKLFSLSPRFKNHLALFNQANYSLVAKGPEVEPGGINDFLDELAEGALSALGQGELSELDVDKAEDILEVIVETSLQGMKGQTTGLSLINQEKMLQDLMEKIIGALDDAGFDQTEKANAAEVALSIAVNTMDETGILTDQNAAQLLSALIKGAILGSGKKVSSGLVAENDESNSDSNSEEEEEETNEERTDAEEESGEGTDSGEETATSEDKDTDGDGTPDEEESEESDNPEDVEVGDIPPSDDTAELDGFDPTESLSGEATEEEVRSAMYHSIMAGSVGALKTAGFDPDEISVLTPKIITSLLNTLSGLGLSKSELKYYLVFALEGAIYGLAQSGIEDPNVMIKAVARTAGGVVSTLDELGFGAETHEQMVSIVVGATVEELDDAKKIPEKEFTKATTWILAEATAALKNLGKSKENPGNLLDVLSSMIASSLANLEELDLSDDNLVAFVTEATGAVFGSLDRLGYSPEDLEALKAEIQDDLKADLEKVDEDIFDDIDYSNLDFDADSSAGDPEEEDNDEDGDDDNNTAGGST